MHDARGQAVRFSQGVSVWVQNSRISPPEDYLQKAFDRRQFAPERIIEAMLKSREDILVETASRLNMAPALLGFVTLQLMKPFIEKLSEATAPLIGNLEWHPENCPETVVFETAALGMRHLDVISQERGYVPMAPSAWNVTN